MVSPNLIDVARSNDGVRMKKKKFMKREVAEKVLAKEEPKKQRSVKEVREAMYGKEKEKK